MNQTWPTGRKHKQSPGKEVYSAGACSLFENGAGKDSKEVRSRRKRNCYLEAHISKIPPEHPLF